MPIWRGRRRSSVTFGACVRCAEVELGSADMGGLVQAEPVSDRATDRRIWRVQHCSCDCGSARPRNRQRPSLVSMVSYASVMPLYLDRHDDVWATPEEVAALHERDLDAQERYGCQFRTYWYDPTNGTGFCLVEGPSKQALNTVHREAHGQVAGTIIELDPDVPLDQLLGALPNYPPGTPYEAPAMRAILFTDLCGSVEQTSRLGDDEHLEMLRVHNKIVRQQLGTHGGREIKHTGDGIMAAFTSVASGAPSAW